MEALLQTLQSHSLELLVALLGGGGGALIYRAISTYFVDPLQDRISAYLKRNPEKGAILEKVFMTLDPIMPIIENNFGTTGRTEVVRLVTKTYLGKGVPEEVVDKMVELYRKAFDPLKQQYKPTILSNLMAQKIAAAIDAKLFKDDGSQNEDGSRSLDANKMAWPEHSGKIDLAQLTLAAAVKAIK